MVGAETVFVGKGSGPAMPGWTGYDAASKVNVIISHYNGSFWTYGRQYSADSMQAPAFYGTSNGGYYVVPDGTSQMVGMYANYYRGNTNAGGTGAASYHPSGVYSLGYNWLYGGISAGGSGIVSVSNITVNGSGWFNAQNNNSSRSGGISLWDQGDGTTSWMGFKYGANIGWGTHGYQSDNYGTWFIMDTSGRAWVFRNMSTNTNVASINNYGDFYTNGVHNGSTLIARSSVNSDYYYDYGGTFAFRIGTATGNTRHIDLANSTTDPSAVGSVTGISSGQRGDSQPYYMIFVRGPYNNGYSTHTRLVLGWHTGVEIGGYRDYGGTRFYNNDPYHGSEIMSVGTGDQNVKITNTLYVPYIVDRDNGGYYIDMNGSSNMYTLTMQNTIYSYSWFRSYNATGWYNESVFKNVRGIPCWYAVFGITDIIPIMYPCSSQ